MELNHTGMKRVALINDLSCFGKCSITVSVPIISAFGVETVPLPTGVLSNHTGGFGSYVLQDMTEQLTTIPAQWQQLGMEFDGIYTGFLCSVEQVERAMDFIRQFARADTLIFVDPVMGDSGELYPIFDSTYVAAMRKLCDMAHIVVPNRTEAALLADLPMDSRDEDILAAIPNADAVITSVQSPGKIGYLARVAGEQLRIEKPKLDHFFHGTGDVFASALCGELMSGVPGPQAVAEAAEFCDRCIAETVKRLPGHWYGLAFEPVLDSWRRRGAL